MPTEFLTIGPIHTLTQNVVYGMPARKVSIISSAILEFSNLIGSGFSALAASTTGVETHSLFVRSTTGNATVSLKV